MKKIFLLLLTSLTTSSYLLSGDTNDNHTTSSEVQSNSDLESFQNDLIALIEKLQNNKDLQEQIYDIFADRLLNVRQELLEHLKTNPAALKAKLELFYSMAAGIIIRALQNNDLRNKVIEKVVDTYTDATEKTIESIKSISINSNKGQILSLVNKGLEASAKLIKS